MRLVGVDHTIISQTAILFRVEEDAINNHTRTKRCQVGLFHANQYLRIPAVTEECAEEGQRKN